MSTGIGGTWTYRLFFDANNSIQYGVNSSYFADPSCVLNFGGMLVLPSSRLFADKRIIIALDCLAMLSIGSQWLHIDAGFESIHHCLPSDAGGQLWTWRGCAAWEESHPCVGQNGLSVRGRVVFEVVTRKVSLTSGEILHIRYDMRYGCIVIIQYSCSRLFSMEAFQSWSDFNRCNF